MNRKLLFTRVLPLTLVLFLGYVAFITNPFSAKVDFNTEIRPILNAKCMRCHGGVKRNGGLSLLFRQEALKENESGLPAIVPGSAAKSELMRRIQHEDPEMRMPYEEAPLNKTEIAVLKRWINQGAQWETHWAYEVPERPAVPKGSWGHNEVDKFVAKRLSHMGLKPAKEADKIALIRRLSLDLTGLPPSPEEVDTFVQDNSPEAYESLVDRLLASPHYGERWASMWLDLARYADSKGYEKDPYRNIWKYRDWVIDAFNQDLPYDAFTRMQLAGDLMQDLPSEEVIATAFHRNTMNNTEGGTEDEEFRVAAVIDRVNTTWTVWQGTTMECVQCHSHPYDPFMQKDYYRSYAFFNQSQDEDLDPEYPFIEEFEPKEDSSVAELLTFFHLPQQAESPSGPLDRIEQIKETLYPRILMADCDGWEDVELNWDHSATNWARNPNNIGDKHFWMFYDDLDLTGVEKIGYTYQSRGDLARVEIRLDEPNGPLFQGMDLLKTTGPPAYQEGKVEVSAGIRDVYVKMVNKGVNDPEGRFRLYDFTLITPDYQISPDEREKQNELIELRKKAQRFPVMRERRDQNKRVTREFFRGNWLSPGDTVEAPAIPASMSGFADELPRNRLGFAEWITGPHNPLTARVMVNRLWEQLYGQGLVPTSEDFGTQGATPTHPDLLDWLALHFQEDLNWSMKGLLKALVMSATYRQDARVSTEKLKKDPENKWLSRGARVRLSAEQVRDQALALSGLLSKKMYGPPVMPPQPDKVWQSVYNNEKWVTSTGEDKYRRAIYTYWKRTSPYPAMVSFDSPSREFCVSRRIATNTPLQALVTLNDTVFLEAAGNLASQMLQAGTALDEQVAYGYERVVFEPPSPRTLETLKGLYQEALTENRSYEQAEPIIEQVSLIETPGPQHAALTVVANALLNLDKVIMKE